MDHQISEEKQKEIIQRLSRTIGHAKTVKSMVESGRDCSEVLIQLSAVKSAVNSTGRELLKEYLKYGLMESVANKDTDNLQEILRAIEMFMK